MPKSLENTHDLVNADFKELQKLILEKHKQSYSVEYIRKVCKEKRNNTMIMAIAKDYLDLKKKMANEMAKLAN